MWQKGRGGRELPSSACRFRVSCPTQPNSVAYDANAAYCSLVARSKKKECKWK